MSIFTKIGKATGHAVKTVGKAVEHTEKKAEHTVTHTVHHVGKTATTATDAVSDVVEEVGKKVANLDPRHIADEVKDEILKTLKTVEKQALATIKNAEQEAGKEIKKVANEALKGLKHEIQSLLEKVEGQTAKEVLSLLVDVARTVNPDDVSVHLGPLTVDIGNVFEKVEKLAHYAEHPPKNKKTWKQFIKDMSPSSVALSASVGFAFIIESSDLEVGIEATWTGDSVIENIDYILEKAGIV